MRSANTRDQQIFEELGLLYPTAVSELNFENNFECLCAVLLSAQCTDKKVNEVTPQLFKLHPDSLSLARAESGLVEQIIREVNYYKTKSRHLIKMAGQLVDNFGGKVPATFKDLESLAGVGHKTASVVLSEQGIFALPVDTHVFRVAKRLGLSRGSGVVAVEQGLKRKFSPEQWHALHHRLIFHGRRVCKAQNPLCGVCTLSGICRSKKKRISKNG